VSKSSGTHPQVMLCTLIQWLSVTNGGVRAIRQMDRILSVLLPFPELHEHRVYVLKGSVYLLPHLGSGEDDLARDEGEDHDLGVCHAVYQPREDLRLILSSIRRATCK